MDIDLTNKIEFLPVFEEQIGVRFEAIYAYDDGCGHIYVNGELHPSRGVHLSQSVEVVLCAYDSKGRLIQKSTEWCTAESFFGFEAFSLIILTHSRDGLDPIAKLRLFPKSM